MFEKLWNESENLKMLNASKEFDYSLTLVWQQQQEGFLTFKEVQLAIQPNLKKTILRRNFDNFDQNPVSRLIKSIFYAKQHVFYLKWMKKLKY